MSHIVHSQLILGRYFLHILWHRMMFGRLRMIYRRICFYIGIVGDNMNMIDSILFDRRFLHRSMSLLRMVVLTNLFLYLVYIHYFDIHRVLRMSIVVMIDNSNMYYIDLDMCMFLFWWDFLHRIRMNNNLIVRMCLVYCMNICMIQFVDRFWMLYMVQLHIMVGLVCMKPIGNHWHRIPDDEIHVHVMIKWILWPTKTAFVCKKPSKVDLLCACFVISLHLEKIWPLAIINWIKFKSI